MHKSTVTASFAGYLLADVIFLVVVGTSIVPHFSAGIEHLFEHFWLTNNHIGKALLYVIGLFAVDYVLLTSTMSRSDRLLRIAGFIYLVLASIVQISYFA